MTLQEAQNKVDQWIKKYGVRYFDVMTNTLVLTEEVGEFSRLIARVYGEQSFKKPTTEKEASSMIADEMADIMFVLICLANQQDINLEEAMLRNLQKKTSRDKDRHIKNNKLKE